MKPLRIRFSAFGSFPGEVSVDFGALVARGLFVVTGDTGTGKTTIFDAMSYALFGEMPSKDGNDIRSHHADPTASTYAEFRFELGGHEYEAFRSPEYQRAKQRGAGTTREAAKGSFVRIEPGGATNNLASGVREMNRVVPEVLGLNATQFRRVMLLPQGEVTRFLLDDSANREALLGALFGGDVYSRIGEVLEADAKALAAEVRDSEEKVRHHTANATTNLLTLHGLLETEVPDAFKRPDGEPPLDRERLGQLADTIAAPYRGLQAEAASRQDDADKATREAEVAKDLVKRMREAADVRGKLDAFAEQEPMVLAHAAAAEASRRARPVLTAGERLNVAEASSSRAASQLNNLTGEIDQIALEHGLTVRTQTPAMALKDIGDVEAANADEIHRLDAMNKAAIKVQAARNRIASVQIGRAEAEADRAAAAEQLQAIEDEVAQLAADPLDIDALDTAHRLLLDAHDQIDTRDQLTSKVSILSEAATAEAGKYEVILRRFIVTEAPRLAAQLRDGEPCAVCGSVDHPTPAVPDGRDPVDFAMVERAKSRSLDAQTEFRNAEDELQRIRVNLGPLADAPLAEIASRIAANREQHQKATGTESRRRALDVDRQQVRARQQAADGRMASLDGQLSTLTDELASAEAASSEAQAAAAGIDREALDRRRRGIDRLRPLVDRLDEVADAAKEASAKLDEARHACDNALIHAGLPDVETARATLIPESDEQAALAARDELRDARSRLEGRLTALVDNGLPEVEPDLEALNAVAEDARTIATELTDRRSRASAAMEDLQKALHGIDDADAGTVALRRRADLTQRAQLVCRGQVAPKVSLRRWVLGRELERVVDAASQHLRKMTAGRYTLRRVTDSMGGNSAKGLDLEVHDAHTGRARKPNSLSGGEQFQASLALALGLADVVSRGGSGSGRKIEALFVDEGFGSLDPRALDDAIATLHQLQATGRMVGAITHVEAMKERLHQGIIVTRLPDGRGSTLTVNP